jgi:hypothetical protein
MFHAKRFSFIYGKSLCRPNRVLNLSSIEVMFRKGIVILLGKRHEVNILKHTDTLDEYFEDCLLGPLIKALVPKRNVDSRLESVVKGLEAGQ